MNTQRSTSLEDIEGMIRHGVLRHIYRIYYEYEHLGQKIDAQFNMHFSTVRAMDGYMKSRERIAGAILVHASPLEKESEQLVTEIEKELKRLSKTDP